MICPVKATPIWTRNAWNSVRKKASISSVTSGRERETKCEVTALQNENNIDSLAECSWACVVTSFRQSRVSQRAETFSAAAPTRLKLQISQIFTQICEGDALSLFQFIVFELFSIQWIPNRIHKR